METRSIYGWPITNWAISIYYWPPQHTHNNPVVVLLSPPSFFFFPRFLPPPCNSHGHGWLRNFSASNRVTRQPSLFRGRRQGDACSREGGRAVVGSGRAKTSKGSQNFSARFSAIQPLDNTDSTWNQILSSLSFQSYPDRPLKVARKFSRTSCNPSFETWFRPIGGEFEGNDSRLLIVAKNPLKWYIYIYIAYVR